MELIVLATRNAGKVRELQRLLGGVAGRFESLIEHPEVHLPQEGLESYRENAHAKAQAVFEALGITVIGDDSGLEVDALGGAPGVSSSRFAGEGASDRENNDLLLAKLKGVPPEKRTARFRCALAFVWSGDESLEVEGVCEGTILEAPRGSGGFGYDPLFLPDGEAWTFGELPTSRKDSISHRARAAAVLGRAIRQRDWMRVTP